MTRRGFLVAAVASTAALVARVALPAPGKAAEPATLTPGDLELLHALRAVAYVKADGTVILGGRPSGVPPGRPGSSSQG